MLPLNSNLQGVVLCWWNNPEAKPQIWLVSINFDCRCKQVHCVMSNRFLIVYSTMIMIRKPPTQQSRTQLRTIPLTRKLTARALEDIMEGISWCQALTSTPMQPKLYHKQNTYRWFAALLAIVIQHSPAIKNKKSSFPVTP